MPLKERQWEPILARLEARGVIEIGGKLREGESAAPTLDACEEVAGPASRWKGRCHEVALALHTAGLVNGRVVYGKFTGRVHPKSFFAYRDVYAKFHGGHDHGWVVLPDGRVLDPTRWVFEAREPYIFVGDAADYAEAIR